LKYSGDIIMPSIGTGLVSLIGKLGATSSAAGAIDAQATDITAMVHDLPALATRGVSTMEAATKAVQSHASKTIQAGGFGTTMINDGTVLSPSDRLKLRGFVASSEARVESMNLMTEAMKARGKEAKAAASFSKATVATIASSVEGAIDVSETAAESGYEVAANANAARWKIDGTAFAH
jgi:hypothetical protein